jgi:hypothetical protein
MTLQRPIAQFGIGLAFGAVTAVVALEIGLLLGFGLIFVIGLIGVLGSRLAFLAGTLVGQGAAILGLMAWTHSLCLPTDNYCGQANLLPLTVIGALLLVAGVVLTVIGARQSRP